MYTLAFGLEFFTLLSALVGAGLACVALWRGNNTALDKQNMESNLALVEKASLGITIGHVIASCILIYALVTYDFVLDYVAGYTDLTLPLFYRLTAFWAGQQGSLLFWALMIALCGAAFQFTTAYKSLSSETRQWYWVFYCAIMAFFSLLLTAWSNPFTMTFPAPLDGRGLNPLLQNPGMIIHPPLLFLGYGGFTIPSCLALAQLLSQQSNNEKKWIEISRPFVMTAWLFLTAGIILGAWWAYMELGWGGYWAWDPVENASLLPWLVGTAALHTMIIEQRREKLQRVNVFLIALTTVSAFFATYLVRGNVVDSVHAFGDGGVGTALLLFVLISFFLLLFIVFSAPRNKKTSALAGVETREGFLIMTTWLLLAITLVILLATLWPLISSLWSTRAIGLDAHFYNRVCLPLFTMLVAILCICPYLGWNGGVREKKNLFIVLGSGCVALGLSWTFGYRVPLAMMATAVSVAAIVSAFIQFSKSSIRNFTPSLAAHGVHLGLALVVLGVAFSGAYKLEKDVTLGIGEKAVLGEYTITLQQLYEGNAPTFTFLEAELVISKNSKNVGMMSPQRRIYHKFGKQAFSEVGTMPSLGNELYASLHGLDEQTKAVMRISISPLVNWIWIGGIFMCLFPLLALGGRANVRKQED